VISFTIPGLPIAQPRPKISTRGGFGRAYVEKDHPIHAYRSAIQLAASQAMQGQQPFEGPVRLAITLLFPRPKSHTKKERSRLAHTQRPDLTNIAKGNEDALNGVIWLDDSQIVVLVMQKSWEPCGGPGSTKIEIEQI
jgi:Holliday junction resolvase RusA-like endonuclease